jgi:hypothetical protein
MAVMAVVGVVPLDWNVATLRGWTAWPAKLAPVNVIV